MGLFQKLSVFTDCFVTGIGVAVGVEVGTGIACDEQARRESIIKELINEKIIFFLRLIIRVNLFRQLCIMNDRRF